MYNKRHNPGIDPHLREELKEEILAQLSRPSYDGQTHAAYLQEKEALRRELLQEISRQKGLGLAGPYRDARRETLTRDIMEEARDLNLTPDELYARLAGPARPSWRGRLKGLVTSREGKSFGWGVGLTLAAVLLAPGARRYVRPVARKVVEEVMEAGSRIQRFVSQTREDLEDLVAEAKFQQFGNSAGGTPAEDDAGPGPGEA
ncbi:MAG TPA: hypothetical protein VMW83_11235 [Spirochaetia bacterium]|nr:hypothetical protein [Spirochaetia bacterium]